MNENNQMFPPIYFSCSILKTIIDSSDISDISDISGHMSDKKVHGTGVLILRYDRHILKCICTTTQNVDVELQEVSSCFYTCSCYPSWPQPGMEMKKKNEREAELVRAIESVRFTVG